MTLDEWKAETTESLFQEIMNSGGFAVDNEFRADGGFAATFIPDDEFFGEVSASFESGTTLHDILATLLFEANGGDDDAESY